MTNLTLSPALGWPLGTAICVIMLVCAVAQIVLHIRRRSQSDETVWACARRSMICALVAIMALTPSIVSSTNSRAINTTDVVVAVDVTGSMAVADAQYGSDEQLSRLDVAKQAVKDIAAMYPNSSFAALRFGASGTLDVPLTPDSKAIDNWADTLAPESTSISAGSTLDVPIDQLLLTCKSIHDQHPDDAIVLYLISDGEQTSSKTRRTFSSLRRYLSDAFTVAVGSEQGGVRPVLIIQNDTGNRYSPTVIAAAITSQTGKARLPTHIDLPVDQSCGLSRNSIILLEQVRTLDKKRLRERMGHVEEAVMEKVDTAIAVSFGLPHDQLV